MDIPLNLSTYKFVGDSEELEQDLNLVIKNIKGSFLQDLSLGATFGVHSDIIDVEQVQKTVEQINGVTFLNCSQNGNIITLYIDYDGTKFETNINTEN